MHSHKELKKIVLNPRPNLKHIAEFYSQSNVAKRLKIENRPDPNEIISLALLNHQIVRPLCKKFGYKKLKFNSGFRCLTLNRAIGSKDTSQHVKGQAVDLEFNGIDNMTLFKWIKDKLEFDQLILEFYKESDPNSGWVHVSYDTKKKNRQSVLMIG